MVGLNHGSNPQVSVHAEAITSDYYVVDPQVIPLGSRVEIREFPGVTFIAQDTGGAIVGRKIDIWFPTVSEALAFGVSEVHLTVLN